MTDSTQSSSSAADTADVDNDLTVDVVVQTPRGSRNAYRIDVDTGQIWLDRQLFIATGFPADYGYVPRTLDGDGRPLDAVVLLDEATFPGCRIRARPIGVLRMTDISGPDAKLLTVPHTDPRWSRLRDVNDIPVVLQEELRQFFALYRNIKPNKSGMSPTWGDRVAAWEVIEAGRSRYADDAFS